ncbi:MAG: competence type IV pilus major pilin ComGC [Eubacteriales bacterium]
MIKLRKALKKKSKGFTLVELVVVIAILGILALIAVPRVLGSLEDANEAARAANVRTLNGSIALYLADSDHTIASLEAGTTSAATVYAILVDADVIQGGLDLGDITYDSTDHMFE